MFFYRVFYGVLAVVCFFTSTQLHASDGIKGDNWKKPVPIFKQKYDWLGLTSDEWLKGDIIALYDEELEFDSDEMGIQIIDIEDIAELRSKDRQSIRLEDGRVIDGYLVIHQGVLTVKNTVETVSVPVTELLSIASSATYERDLWNGEVKLGMNIRGGNTEQFDYNFYTEMQRRTSTSRFKGTFTADFSEGKNNDSGSNEEIANSKTLTAYYDWFFSQKVFFRALDFEYFSDKFQNIKHRYTIGSSLGYHLIDTKKTTWDVTLGPSYQRTTLYDSESSNDTKSSSVVMLGSEFEYEVTKYIDAELYYQVKFVNSDAGQYIHALEASLEVELINDFDLDLTFYLDRTENPQPNEDGSEPDKNDYRFVVGLSYDF